jgi:hypothetical protein
MTFTRKVCVFHTLYSINYGTRILLQARQDTPPGLVKTAAARLDTLQGQAKTAAVILARQATPPGLRGNTKQ